MRSALIGFLISGLALLLIGAAASAATQDRPGVAVFNTLLAPEVGNKTCYIRSYDAAHLRAHPRQRITTMKLALGVTAYDPKPAGATRPEALVYYTFGMSVSCRDDKRLHTSGDCCSSDDISCVVDCDGGVPLHKMPLAGSLIVRLKNDGIHMLHDCDDEEGVLVKPGADDKVFRLEKAANEACRALDEK